MVVQCTMHCQFPIYPGLFKGEIHINKCKLIAHIVIYKLMNVFSEHLLSKFIQLQMQII